MTTVTQLHTVDDVIKRWPRLCVLARAERISADAKDDATTLQMFLSCIQKGAVFVINGDKGMMGFTCVETNGDETAYLRSIPSAFVPKLANTCLDAVMGWCKQNGFDELQCTTNRLNGSTNRYFTKTLSFKLHTVTFTKKVTQIYG